MTSAPRGPAAPPAARAVAEALIGVPGVRAVLLGGSAATGGADAHSDLDCYALVAGNLPDYGERARALGRVADGGDVVEQTTWGPEDHLAVGGRPVEVVYLDLAGLGIEACYDLGANPNGYTTAFLHTLDAGVPLADPHGDLATLRDRLRLYPEATRERIAAQAPGELEAYLAQLRTAQARADWTAVTHRRAAFQATWFDLLFALNRRYHPGEKRLLAHLAGCPVQPDDAVARWVAASLAPADDPGLPERLAALAADLIALLDA